MRTLIFDEPQKVTYTGFVKEYVNTPEPCYYQKSCAVLTKRGIVIVEDMDWKHNHGKSYFTVFTTIIQGLKYSATLKEGNLSDRQIKWLATNFITLLHKKFEIHNG